jgi:hypothetical protein
LPSLGLDRRYFCIAHAGEDADVEQLLSCSD